jgi:hypothetical protein
VAVVVVSILAMPVIQAPTLYSAQLLLLAAAEVRATLIQILHLVVQVVVVVVQAADIVVVVAVEQAVQAQTPVRNLILVLLLQIGVNLDKEILADTVIKTLMDLADPVVLELVLQLPVVQLHEQEVVQAHRG